MGGMEAAFFDLDKTVIDRASIAAFGRPFMKGGLINRRVVARAAFSQLIYLYFGADEERLVRVRQSMLAMTKGWDRDQVRQIVRETLLADDRADHVRRGARTDGAPPGRRSPGLPRLGLTRGDRAPAHRHARRRRRHLLAGRDRRRRVATPAAWPFTPTARQKATAIRELAGRDRDRPRPPAAPTRTRPPISPCSRPWADRWR